RVDGDHVEPYTWVRTHGKGRVFYTAWGHDERTWGNKDFLDLLERGLRWTAGDWALEPQPKLKPFEYVEANIPNYPAGEQWGRTATPFKQMQKPVSPEESDRKSTRLNSSHDQISYAVFCLKKKNKTKT